MKLFVPLLFFLPSIVYGQHTFSIVAIDPITLEVGSAGATCGDAIIWPGTPGAALISDVIPAVGAVHTQSYWNQTNQNHAHDRMLEGYDADSLVDWLVENDSQENASIRQYGAVTWFNDSIVSSAFTGANCMDYKNHIIGDTYAIQGNILLGQSILDSMETGFLNTEGSFADKLMAALQGAKVIGADTRCADDMVSSLSAFLRVAQPDDLIDDLFIDIVVPSTPAYVDPIDVVQETYTNLHIDEAILNETGPKLVRVVDVLGRPSSPQSCGVILFYLYEDGTVEKRVHIE